VGIRPDIILSKEAIGYASRITLVPAESLADSEAPTMPGEVGKAGEVGGGWQPCAGHLPWWGRRKGSKPRTA